MISKRFFDKVEKLDTGCWLWTGYRQPNNGYGKFSMGGHLMMAHRAAYEIFVGDIPKGMLVLHSCHNPACVNPDHLRLGDQADNMQDKVDADRQHRGEQIVQSKLTGDQVLDIRRRYAAGGVTQYALADEYGVGQDQISRIVNNKLWRV